MRHQFLVRKEGAMRRLRPSREVTSYRKNHENLFASAARENGWEVTKVGFPTFICYRGNDFMLVEVKPKKTYRNKLAVQRFNSAVKKRGIKTYRWYPQRDWFGADET